MQELQSWRERFLKVQQRLRNWQRRSCPCKGWRRDLESQILWKQIKGSGRKRKQSWNWKRKHFGDWYRQKSGRFLRQTDESGRLRHRLWNGRWDGRDMLPIIKKRFRSKNRFRNVWRKSWMVPSQHLKRKIKM